MIVSHDDLKNFFRKVAQDFDIFLPYELELELGGDNLSYRKFSGDINFVLDKYRAIEPVKTLFYFPIEEVLPAPSGERKRIVAGVKNCDLLGLDVLDSALLEGDFEEPAYKKWRENTYIISTDCMDALPTCHCVLLGNNPFPENGEKGRALFDLNITPLEEDFFITVGSEKGEELLRMIKKHVHLLEATTVDRDKIEAIHAEMLKKLRDINNDYSMDRKYDVISDNRDKETWQEFCKDCIECGGCTNICPTCYCIILNDESQGDEFRKIRTWDSCQLSGYARVAGGASPRPELWERFRNRYQCKFNFMMSNFNKLGCTGCGRCISTCPAEIDLREVIQSLQEV
ncbi:MAG: 4Fe-4S dicluster domain-containing protein [Candidatus Cloacimonadia bacterium]